MKFLNFITYDMKGGKKKIIIFLRISENYVYTNLKPFYLIKY